MSCVRASLVLLGLSFALLACDGEGSKAKGTSTSKGTSETGSTSSTGASGGASGVAATLQASAADLPAADRKYVVDPALTDIVFDDVKLAKETIVVPSAALTESSGSVGTQTFDTAALASAGTDLREGSVLVVPGRLLGKVSWVEVSGSKTIVKTEFAALTDAFVDAKIGWSATLPLERDNVIAMVMPDGRELPVHKPVMYAALGHTIFRAPPGPMEWSLKDGQLTYLAKLDQGNDYLDFVVQVTRKMANTGGMTYTGRLRLKPVAVSGAANIDAGKTTNIDIEQSEVGGEIELSIAAAGAGRSELNKELPMPLFKWIVMVGPIPVAITAKAKVIGRVDLPAKGSAVATAQFSFGGGAGFRFDGTTVEAKAAFPKDNFKIDKIFDAAGFIGGAVDAQFGIAFPVLGMAMFDSFFMPELIPGAQMGVRLTWGPVCKTGYLLYTVKAAYDFKVLGVSLRRAKTPIYEKTKHSKGQKCEDKK